MEEEQYYTTDRQTVLFLLCSGVNIIETKKDYRNKTKFYFPITKANEVLAKFKMGHDPEFRFSVYMRALNLFNSIVHSTK